MDKKIQTNQNDSEVIEEAEIIEIQDSMESSNSKVEEILRLEGLIKKYLFNISNIEKDLREKRTMFGDIFSNDAIYKQHEDKVKEMTRIKNNTKAEILKQGESYELMTKIKDTRDQLKELKKDLSEYAQKYYEVSGSKQITSDDGQEMEIVLTTKIVKKNSKFNP
jgi:hypothetical protein